jgi:hypothetical protein
MLNRFDISRAAELNRGGGAGLFGDEIVVEQAFWALARPDNLLGFNYTHLLKLCFSQLQ